MTIEELNGLLAQPENEHLEVKEAKCNIDSEELLDYCAALANEGGGKIVLGVTNKRPRTVVGTALFLGEGLERRKHDILTRLRLRVDIREVIHPDGRVLVLDVPPHPPGTPVESPRGRYLMRAGESLVGMSPDVLRRIFSEIVPEDFSAEVCPRASLADLDPRAAMAFRERWARKTGSGRVLGLADEHLLRDAELLEPAGLTYAALILFGTREALGRLNLAHAEVIFEYRSNEAAGPAQDRKEYRAGFLAFHDDLWNSINLRNDKQHYQEGLFIWDIPTFSEPVVREAILLDIVNRGAPVPQELRARVPALVDEGVLGRVGHGRVVRLTLSRKFYHFTGRKGTYTRLRGLDRETNKALLLRHLEDNREQGSPLSELNQVLPGLSVLQVQNLLRELKAERRAHSVGRTRGGLWLPGAGPS